MRQNCKTPFFFFSSRRRHTSWNCDWSSDVCSSDLSGSPAGSPGCPGRTARYWRRPRRSSNGSPATATERPDRPQWRRYRRRGRVDRVRVFVRSTFQSLQVRNYRLFATGQLISLIFGWVQITAQDWLVLQVSHDSPSALGVVTALQFSPMLLFTLYAGKLADRFDKRYLLMAVNALWLVLAALMGALVVSGAVQLWQVYVFAALWGTVSAVETPVRQSFVSELVDRSLLPNALSLSAATFNTARILGPALAGVTIAALGTGTAFVVNAVSYVFPVVAIARMRPGEL